MDKFTERTLGCERKYTGKIIRVDLLDIELPDGRKAKREVIRHGNDPRFEDAVRVGLLQADEMMVL